MNKIISSAWNYVEGLNGFLLILYTSAVMSAYVVLMNESTDEISRLIILSFFSSVILCPLLIKSIRRTDLNKLPLINKELKVKHIKLWLFVIPFLSLFAHYLIYYPGGFSNDSMSQYEQAITNTYSDWHPFIHTLLAFKLPLTLTGGWVGSIVLFQVILLSLAIGYALCTVLKHTNNRITLVLLLLIVLNPQLLNISMYPWKDVAFAIGALFLVAFAVNIYYSSGDWAKNISNVVVLVLTLALTTLVRHNAILFTGPYVVAIALIIGKKRALVVVLSAIVLFVGVKYPLYNAFDVSKPGQRQLEMLGLPMSVIGAVVSSTPDSLDEETKEFAYKIAPANVWENYDNGYNTIKFNAQTNNEIIEEYGAKNVLIMMLKCIKSAPIISLKGLIKVTCPVYSVVGDHVRVEEPDISGFNYDIQGKGIPVLQALDICYSAFCSIVFPHLFFYTGAVHLLILILILAKLKLNKLDDWKRILLIAPMFIYNFGTMLLLTGAADASRFFFYSFLIAPLYLLLLLKSHKTSAQQE